MALWKTILDMLNYDRRDYEKTYTVTELLYQLIYEKLLISLILVELLHKQKEGSIELPIALYR